MQWNCAQCNVSTLINFLPILTAVSWSPTFKKVWVVASIWAKEEELLRLGLGGQNGDSIAYALYGDSIWCRYLAWQGHLCCGHSHQTRTDLIQMKKIAGSLLSTLLQAHHDLTNTQSTWIKLAKRCYCVQSIMTVSIMYRKYTCI